MLGFLAKVVVISASGALSPGPLTIATASVGVKHGWRGGFWVSVGHALVEFPFIALLTTGVMVATITSPLTKTILAFVGGVFMLWFGYMTIRDSIRSGGEQPKQELQEITKSPLLVGIGLSGLNPFFLIWWATIGTVLIFEAISIWGWLGVPILFAAHIWLDFVWLGFVAQATYVGGRGGLYNKLLLLLGIVLIVFGVDFLYTAFAGQHLLPL